MRVGFWGLQVEPSNAYSQDIDADFQVTMAALSADVKPNDKVTLYVTINDNKFALCTLVAGKVDQQALDLTFVEGDSVSFSVVGKASVHLTGNYVIDAPFPPADMDDDSEDEELDDDDDDENLEGIPEDILRKLQAIKARRQAEGDDDDDDLIGEEDDEDDDEIDEDSMEIESVVENGKRKAVNGNQKGETKKAKVEEPKKQQEKGKKQPEQQKQAEPKKKPEEKPQEKKEKKEKNDSPKALPSGLIIEDKVVGTGPKAKKNQKVAMRYIGRLTNGKVFDSNTKGAPFMFKLGKGEVIKGWDMGIMGMNVGGERKLTIPPNMAYGSKGAPPDIPPNATLQFEVKLLEIK